jgi:pimeloyl-ACP methyl ester carboxylesterase
MRCLKRFLNKLKILRDLEVKKLKKLLLFIHGLGGSKKSFGDFEKYIKEDSSLEEYEVDYYEYPTIKLYNPISWIIAAKIQSLADGLRTDIVTRYKRYDYIVLIGHSMGGLISKQYLLDEEENILNFSNPVKKVVMYGTPNIGSDYSKWFLSFNPQIRQLNRDSDFIEFLNRSLKKHKLIDYIDFYYVIGDKDRIVNRLSASNFWDTKFYSIPNKSHAMGNGVAKPKSKEDRTFTLLKNFLEKEQGLPNLTHDYLSKIIKHSTLDADNRYSLNNEKFKGTHIEIKEIDKAFSYIQNKKNFINELENLLSDIIYSQPSLEDYENIIPDLNKAKDAHASYFEEEEWEDLVGLEEKDMKIKEINDAFIFDILEKVENLKNSTYKSKQTILIDIREKIDLLIDQIYKKNSLHSALNPRGGFDETTSINDYAIISPITNKVEEIQELIYSIYAELYINQALLISGEALIGKTHMLCHISNRYIDEKKPIILILGHTVTTVTDLKKMILEKLDLSYLKFENFLKELNLLGEINNCNSLIVIDAINEAGDNKTWLNQLAGLLSEIKEYNNISIILSVRDVEEYRVINKTSENLITKIIHVGIEELTFEQFDNFCKIFDIHTPDIPIMNKINYNPGLLLLFLESLEKLDLKYIDTDILSPSYIFENIIKGSNRRISQKHSLDEDAELSQIAINLITEKFIEQEGNPILYKDAYRILQDKNLGIELIDLISEGLLGTFMKRDLKYVFFTYQKLGNYFISKFILNKYINFKDNHPTNETVTFLTRIITNNDHPWNNIMVLESISTLISETYNHELIEILDKYKNNGVIQITFMRSLLWRNKNSFNEITFKYLKELLKVNKDNRDNYFELLEVLLKLSTIPDHPLNAHRLQKHLKSQNMTIRDANWGEFLINSDKYRSIARIINWNWFYSSNYNIPEKVIILNGITLSWMLSSSDNEIRDQATKALVSIFTNKPVLFLSLLKMFEDIDDLYILERLYAVGYGIALRETNSLNLASLAIYVYDIQFKNNTPYPNILLRDFGRGIVELSCIEINTNLINPPYISTLSFDNIDINNLITYKNKKGFLQIWSSLMYDNNGGISDFGNYVVNRSLSNWSFHELNEQEAIPKNELDSFISNLDADKQSLWKKRINTKELMNIFTNEKDSENALQEYLNGIKEKKTKFEESLSLEESEIFNKNIKPDLDNNDKLIDRKKIFNYSLAQQWMFKRIIELGYSESTHGEIDKYLRSYNRRGKKIERIGKKYQWISYYELLARVSDNYKLSNRFDYNESKSYCGPWNPLIRNIDPSTILYKKEIAENYKLHFSYDFSSNENNLSEWLDNTSDVSSLQRIIENKFEHNNHLFLYGIFTFIDVTEKKDRKPQKQIYYKLQSYLVKNDEIENLFEWSKSQDFFGNWIPEQGDFYEVFLREYPHSRAFKDIDYKREGWTDCENELPNKIACSWDSYLNEVTNDSSIKESITLKLPSKILIETLGLIQDMKKDGVYHHKKLEDVIFDSSLQYTEESALLAKEEILDLLNTEGYALFWTLTGEKEIINRPSTLTELRLVISASGYYKDNEFIENYNFYRE